MPDRKRRNAATSHLFEKSTKNVVPGDVPPGENRGGFASLKGFKTLEEPDKLNDNSGLLSEEQVKPGSTIPEESGEILVRKGRVRPRRR